MAQTFVMPQGRVVDDSGNLTLAWRSYLAGIQKIWPKIAAAEAIATLDDGTSYTNDELRDKIIALQTALNT